MRGGGKPATYEIPEYDVLTMLEKMRLTGESSMDTARRVLVNCALARTKGNQMQAARVLGLSTKTMTNWLGDLRLRPVDRERVAGG